MVGGYGRPGASREVLSFSLRSLPPERTDRDRVDVAFGSDWTIALEKCRTRQTDQAPARERHGQRLSRRNHCRLIYPSRNGARYRVYVKAAICQRRSL